MNLISKTFNTKALAGLALLMLSATPSWAQTTSEMPMNPEQMRQQQQRMMGQMQQRMGRMNEMMAHTKSDYQSMCKIKLEKRKELNAKNSLFSQSF